MGVFSDIIREDSYNEGYEEGYKKERQKTINNLLPLFIKRLEKNTPTSK